MFPGCAQSTGIHHLWTFYTIWCNSGLIPCMPGDMLISSLADKTTNTLLRPKTTHDYLPKFSIVPLCTPHLWRDMEEKGVRAVVQQDKTGKGKQGENKGHCVTCHHHAPMGHGEWGGGEAHNGLSGSLDWALASVAFILHCVGLQWQHLHFISRPHGWFISLDNSLNLVSIFCRTDVTIIMNKMAGQKSA